MDIEQETSELARRIAGELTQQTGYDCPEDKPDSCRMVKPEAIANLITLLRQVLFPHLLPADADLDESHSDTGSRIASILDRTSDSLMGLIRNATIDIDGDSIDADRIAREFLECLPTIQVTLLTDVKAAYDGDPACKCLEEVVLCYPGVLAVTVYRLAHELVKMKVPLLPRMMSEWAHSETGIDIHPGATIGGYFFIDHGTGVVIGETCEIGENVKIYQGVTLGALSFPKDETGKLVRDAKRHPTIEDDVVIYANATVLGGKTVVGKASVIGSSVWLTSSVQPMTTVVMEPPKLKLRNGKSNGPHRTQPAGAGNANGNRGTSQPAIPIRETSVPDDFQI